MKTDIDIKNQLNALAEIQAQQTLLQMNRAKMLESIQVPADILDLQKEASKRKQRLSDLHLDLTNALEEELTQRLAQVVVPAEVLEILNKIDAQRDTIRAEISQRKAESYEATQQHIQDVDADLASKTEDVFRQIQQKKFDILAEFLGQEDAASKNADDLIARIKSDVEELGASIKGDFLMGVYTKGRTTWSTDVLDDVYFRLNDVLTMVQSFVAMQEELSGIRGALNAAILAMSKARKVGKPSVSIRRI
jgi:hypothetical protein